MKRVIRFFQYWFFTLSFSGAVRLDRFDNHKKHNGK